MLTPFVRMHLTNVALGLLCGTFAHAADWPMWRYDAARTGVTPSKISTNLHLNWQRQLPAADPAWPKTQKQLQFDSAPHPIVAGEQILITSSLHDSVSSFSTRDGKFNWRFYADGPIRFAPVADNGKIYFTSDDGHLYCLNDQGQLLWKKNGGPSRRLNLGNERMISAWPARGGPVLHDDRVYFAASIWPFMGVFIHAVNAETGQTVWTNSGDGTNLTIQPHGALSFATVAPQGHLALGKDALIVPGGRSIPAVYSLQTGKLLHFQYDKKHGGHEVFVAHNQYFVNDVAYELQTGKRLDNLNAELFDQDAIFGSDGSKLVRYDLQFQTNEETTRDRIGRKKVKKKTERAKSEKKLEERVDRLLIKSKGLIWATRKDKLLAFDARSPKNVLWEYEFEEPVWDAIVADDRLFVITKDQQLFCFSANRTRDVIQHSEAKPTPQEVRSLDENERQMVEQMSGTAGYGLCLGVPSIEWVRAILKNSKLHLVVLDENKTAIDQFRIRVQQLGWNIPDEDEAFEQRVHAIVGDLRSCQLPKYFASVAVSTSNYSLNSHALQQIHSTLRPYGGFAVLPSSEKRHQTISRLLAGHSEFQGKVTRVAMSTRFDRPGPLPETDDWTHQYANSAQTSISQDLRVKAPLGMLWFGGRSHDGILPRHGHGPAPQVAGGRLFIEGPDLIRCLDVYTGRLLWETKLKDVGAYYDETKHVPGANEVGSNYVSTAEFVYVVNGSKILQLDAVDGSFAGEFKLEDPSNQASWGHISVSGDYLITTSTPVAVRIEKDGGKKKSKDEIELEVIKQHSEWKFLTRDPPKGWQRLGFNDSGWKKGTAGFGFSDDDDKTKLDFMKKKLSRVYVRHEFLSGQLKGATKLELMCRYDDGFIAYLNGQEVCRSNSIKGRGARAEVESHEADKFDDFELKDWKSKVRRGVNVLAIEGHNRTKHSSDLSLDPFLVVKKSLSNQPQIPETSQPIRNFLTPKRHASGSLRLVVFNRHTAEKLWHRDAEYNFRHNTICSGNGMVFCIDRFSDVKVRALKRRGIALTEKPKIYAFDLSTGNLLWKRDENVFGTFLNYSTANELLIQGGSLYRDRAADEVGKGINAISGVNGDLVWNQPDLLYNGPVMLFANRIITNGNKGFEIELQTGAKTGWKFAREYGCNTAQGCPNMLTFRSGAAGFYDLLNDSGTGNVGGFRSSCTNNLLPANGVLSAPDYTRTCTCAYQNQTSLALVHMPEAEFWTFGQRNQPGRLAINFGAPGDRSQSVGKTWFEYPVVGGKSPELGLKVEPANVELYRHHSSNFPGPFGWVASSGVSGVERVRAKLTPKRRYRVRLYFAEPFSASTLNRKFDVQINRRRVLSDFDISRQAGGTKKLHVAEFATKTGSDGKIEILFQQKSKDPPVISGVEFDQI